MRTDRNYEANSLFAILRLNTEVYIESAQCLQKVLIVQFVPLRKHLTSPLHNLVGGRSYPSLGCDAT
jgi:hypothetical protein